MTSPISEFRDIVHHLFRVVHPAAYASSDLHILIDKIHDVLRREANAPDPYFPPFEFLRPPIHVHEPPTLVIHPDQEVGEVVPNVVVTKEEPEGSSVRNVVVNIQSPLIHAVKVDTHNTHLDKEIMKTVMSDVEEANSQISTESEAAEAEVEDEVEEEDDNETEDAEMAEEEEAEEAEDEEAEEEEAEEEEDEDDDLELLKIKKQKYYFSPSSKRIYEWLEEGYGDCIGTFVDGKIIPKE